MPGLERISIQSELTPPFTILEPRPQCAPVVVCSPHSGRVYPLRFLAQSRLDARALRKSEDCYVDELLAGVASFGAPLLAARFPRAYLDVNREPFELDPALFSEPLPSFANTRSTRVAGGLGTIARIVADGEEIYERRLALGVAFERIERLYFPFHAALMGLLAATKARFGAAVLIDCHSMPSQAQAARPDFVLGDRFGSACDRSMTRLLRELLSNAGYEVELNRPYAGGYITEHYGEPRSGVHALQIEINRGLYLDEVSLERAQNFTTIQRDLSDVLSRLFAELPQLLAPRAAAE